MLAYGPMRGQFNNLVNLFAKLPHRALKCTHKAIQGSHGKIPDQEKSTLYCVIYHNIYIATKCDHLTPYSEKTT